MQLMYVQPPTGYTKPEKEELTEYPKFLHFTDGRQSVIVDNAEDEAKASAAPDVPSMVIPPLAATVAVAHDILQTSNESVPVAAPVVSDDKAILIAQAESKGVKIDKRWSAAKIKAALEA